MDVDTSKKIESQIKRFEERELLIIQSKENINQYKPNTPIIGMNNTTTNINNISSDHMNIQDISGGSDSVLNQSTDSTEMVDDDHLGGELDESG